MGNVMDKYKLQIEEAKNNISEAYKKLFAGYEELRELYEEIIEEYEAANGEIAICSRVGGINTTSGKVRWVISGLDGVIVYQSEDYLPKQRWIFDLDTLNTKAPTKYVIQVINENGIVVASDVKLLYLPKINARALFQAKGDAANLELDYIGRIFK